MFPLPRVIYAMATDGLIFRSLAKINERFKTPLIATFISGFLAALMAMLFDLTELVNMLAIGTLMAYSLVAISILILRAVPDVTPEDRIASVSVSTDAVADGIVSINERLLLTSSASYYPSSFFRRYLKYSFIRMSDEPNRTTERITQVNTVLMALFVLTLNLLLIQPDLSIIGIIIPSCIMSFLAILATLSLHIQPQNKRKLHFKVPFVPWLPLFSIFVNLQLMLKLPVSTWYRFAIWMAIGFLIYFAYGIWHSSERKGRVEEPAEALYTLTDDDQEKIR